MNLSDFKFWGNLEKGKEILPQISQAQSPREVRDGDNGEESKDEIKCAMQ